MSLSTTQWGRTSVLSSAATADDTTLSIAPADAAGLAVAPGTHYYLTLRSGSRREVVRVVGSVATELLVERGQDGTTPQSWPILTCVVVEWNPLQLREFIESIGAGTEPTGVAPGTYCVDCTTCLTINAAGQITAVDGAGGCA